MTREYLSSQVGGNDGSIVVAPFENRASGTDTGCGGVNAGHVCCESELFRLPIVVYRHRTHVLVVSTACNRLDPARLRGFLRVEIDEPPIST